MAAWQDVERLAGTLPDVTPKRHFRYDGMAVGGKVFVHLNKGDLMAGTSAEDAARLADAHPDMISVLHRNDKPIGVRAELAALPEDLLREILTVSHGQFHK